MATTEKLQWDKTSERFYEAGVDQGVLYPQDANGNYTAGVAWNGLIGLNEAPEGGDSEPIYANNNAYLNITAPEKFKGTIKAYQSPAEFDQCDGTANVLADDKVTVVKGLKATGQTRVPFGLSYRTGVGNDTQGIGYGYQIHLVYNATAAVSTRDRTTINDKPEAMELSWDFNTTPIPIPGMKPSAHLIIDSTEANLSGIKALEDVLYGSSTAAAKLPLPAEVITLLNTP